MSQGLAEGEGMCQLFWGKNVLGQGQSPCKDPKVGPCRGCARSYEDTVLPVRAQCPVHSGPPITICWRLEYGLLGLQPNGLQLIRTVPLIKWTPFPWDKLVGLNQTKLFAFWLIGYWLCDPWQITYTLSFCLFLFAEGLQLGLIE